MRPPSRRRGQGTPREISAGEDDEDEERPSSSDDKDANTAIELRSCRLCRAREGL